MGEELAGYFAADRSPIICFEPQEVDWPFTPEDATLVRVALSDVDGWMTLQVPERLHHDGWDTQMASGLSPIPAMWLRMGWAPTPIDYMPVHMMRFDTWARQVVFASGSCDLLVIDVQGMELQVLQGFGSYLDGFHTIIVECAEEPCWFGQSSTELVASFLSTRGFKQATPTLACGDVRFEKEGENDTDV